VIVQRRKLVERNYLSSVGTSRNLSLELIQFLLIAGRRELNRTIRSVGNPSRELQAPRLDSHEPAESDSLNAAAHQETHRRHSRYPLFRRNAANSAAMAASGGVPLNS
jgi:hypothetical protein